MIINIEKINGGWRADCEDLPGSPPIGMGKTKEMALASLFYRIMFSDGSIWSKYINQDNPLIINGKMWKSPFKTKR